MPPPPAEDQTSSFDGVAQPVCEGLFDKQVADVQLLRRTTLLGSHMQPRQLPTTRQPQQPPALYACPYLLIYGAYSMTPVSAACTGPVNQSCWVMTLKKSLHTWPQNSLRLPLTQLMATSSEPLFHSVQQKTVSIHVKASMPQSIPVFQSDFC